MAKGNKPGEDLNDIQSQTDDLLKSLDSLDKPSKASPQFASTRNTRDPSPDKLLTQKSSSSSVKTILVAAGSFAGIAVVIIGGLIALEASKQATLNQQAELAAQEARETRETAARVQAELARDREEREQAARELAERERAAKEKTAREQATREGYVICSFNYEIRACKLDYLSDGLRITWRDGMKMKYYGKPLNNTFLRDSLGGSWMYLDFDTGKAFSLTNPSNGNVIIWNGTYKMYGQYVGL